MTPEDKKLCERLNQWGASGHTMGLFIGQRNLGHECMDAAQAIERLSALYENAKSGFNTMSSRALKAEKELTTLKAENERLSAEKAGLKYVAENWHDMWKESEKELATLRAQLAEQEPVAWRTFDGEGGYDYRCYEGCENWQKDWNKRNPNHVGWVEPLFLHPAEDAKDAEIQRLRKVMFDAWDDTDWLLIANEVHDMKGAK